MASVQSFNDLKKIIIIFFFLYKIIVIIIIRTRFNLIFKKIFVLIVPPANKYHKFLWFKKTLKIYKTRHTWFNHNIMQNKINLFNLDLRKQGKEEEYLKKALKGNCQIRNDL